MSQEKISKMPGIDSSSAYNTRSQRAESQLYGGKSIVDEKDEKIDNLLSRLTEQHNLILKLTSALYDGKSKYLELIEEKDEEIAILKNQIKLEQRRICMQREQLEHLCIEKSNTSEN